MVKFLSDVISIDELVEHLLNQESLFIMSVPGIGKTTLTLQAYRKIYEEGHNKMMSLTMPLKSLLAQKYNTFVKMIDDPNQVALNIMFHTKKTYKPISFETYDFLYYLLTQQYDPVRPIMKTNLRNIVTFDESHMTLSRNSMNTFAKTLEYMKATTATINITTATIPSKIEEFIIEKILKKKTGNPIIIDDITRDYPDRIKEVTKITAPQEFYPATIRDTINLNSKSLIILNTINKAKEVYKTIKTELGLTGADDVVKNYLHENGLDLSLFLSKLYTDEKYREKFKDEIKNQTDIILLTSEIPQFLKEVYEEIIEDESNNIKTIISTQVTEVGFDNKKINHLITEPCPVNSLIQRIGRIRVKGRVTLIIPDKKQENINLPYPDSEYNLIFNYLSNFREEDLTTEFNEVLTSSKSAQTFIDNLTPDELINDVLKQVKNLIYSSHISQEHFRDSGLQVVYPLSFLNGIENKNNHIKKAGVVSSSTKFMKYYNIVSDKEQIVVGIPEKTKYEEKMKYANIYNFKKKELYKTTKYFLLFIPDDIYLKEFIHEDTIEEIL